MFLIMAQPKTNCNFRTFRVEESFWTKKQSCKLLKVDITKWRPFFVFVCFNGCHFLNHKKSRNLAHRFSSLYFRKLSAGCPRDNIKKLEIVISLNSFFFFQSTVKVWWKKMVLTFGRITQNLLTLQQNCSS